METNNKSEGIIPDWIETGIGEIQSILALSYLLLLLIGMINEAIYFHLFGINIFEYSVIFDFLIAPFKKIEYLMILMLTLGVSMLTFYVDLKIEKTWPRIYHWLSFGLETKTWYKSYRLLMFLFVFLFLLTTYSFLVGSEKKEQIYERTQPDLELILDGNNNRKLVGHKIGSNSSYIFLLDQQKQVRILPIQAKVEQILLKQSEE